MGVAPECVLSAETIAARVSDLGARIRSEYAAEPLTLLGILKGAAIFTADLARAVGGGVELSFVHARSYGKETFSSGRVAVGELESDVLEGRRVVVTDTILDTGLTLSRVVEKVRARGAADVVTCVLLDKPARRRVEITPDLVGFTVEDRFLVGYGLDHAGRYRALPYVAALEEAVGG